MTSLPKYKQNLGIDGNNVWSYSTIVAKRDGKRFDPIGVLERNNPEAH